MILHYTNLQIHITALSWLHVLYNPPPSPLSKKKKLQSQPIQKLPQHHRFPHRIIQPFMKRHPHLLLGCRLLLLRTARHLRQQLRLDDAPKEVLLHHQAVFHNRHVVDLLAL